MSLLALAFADMRLGTEKPEGLIPLFQGAARDLVKAGTLRNTYLSLPRK